MKNKINIFKYFKKTFFVTNTKFKMILKMFFLKFSNANILFGKKSFI